ncbi:General stress protein 69 [Poriferisphaera corsica]|uniref:General stress protein 69 n=1 Tax=Poriferisphaera corsica TaxID=2528020 RepID=A0A517YWZ2_9BACT|nr:aldo/keto reductase [Poriferisphaera corsica]QDU34748.1 General stress protein 69 [Poriferisphaera corsica]
MEYRILGRTGIRVSPLTLGTMTYGSTTSQDEADKIVATSIDAGINLIDTANVYNTGISEQFVGKAIAKTGLREHIVLATKCHGNMFKDQPLNPNRWGNSRRQIIQQCEASLTRLNTDYIDLYQIHRPDPHCPIDETMRALDDLVRSGKVRYIGCSTFAAWQLVESLWVSEKLSLNRFVTEQPPYNLLDRRIERELIPACQHYGLGILPWSPLAGGFLTGKYTRQNTSPKDARYTNSQNPRVNELMSERCFDAIEKLQELARQKDTSLTTLSLAWCMNQPGITSPIIGPRTLEQLIDNLSALNLSITDADREAIDSIIPPGTFLSHYYDTRSYEYRSGQ